MSLPGAGIRHSLRLVALALLACAALPCRGVIEVNVSGPGGKASQLLPDAGGSFEMNVPLSRNAVNSITVTARDRHGNSQAAELAITQVSLDQVVVSKVTSERLSVQEVERLVSDGTIKLDNPANYNVSQFTVVLTIGTQQVPVSMPIAFPIEQPLPTGYEVYKLPYGRDSGGAPPKLPENMEIIVFEQMMPPDAPVPLPPIPGVIIIDGKIKSLKEFFSVRLLLMNTSGIFTLSNVVANVAFPAGGLTSILPADGIASFGQILPGTGGEPGQVEKEFVVRGDEIGTRDIVVSFGGVIAGPGIPETNAIPFNGSAKTSVEVKGPPTFQVTVLHPDYVTENEPYDLTVEILNTGELPAMYSSLELDVGADARLVNVNASNDPPTFEYLEGPVTRAFGHILPGTRVRETYQVLPLKTGPISSCMGISDQNISLQVVVGNLGCVTGHYPPLTGVPSGIPTVTVLPFANALGIGLDSPVVAMFSEPMQTNTITTGSSGTFNVYNKAGELVPGVLRYVTLSGRTMAIWQEYDGVRNRLMPAEEYTVCISTNITDRDGNGVFNEWYSKFKTTTEGFGDVDPPTLSLSIEPPVNPNNVLPGELIRVNAYASDQGSGVMRVELRTKDLDGTNQLYELVDQKSVFKGDKPPFLFALDSARMALGHVYQLMGTAYDAMGNQRDSTLSVVIAPSADPPTLVLPESPTNAQLHGIAVTLRPLALTGGAHEVRYYLDGASNAYKTVTLPPWQASLSTLTLSLTNHTIRAVAEDGLRQTGEDTYAFTLIENINMPVVSFLGAASGALYVQGDWLSVKPNVEDPVGVRSVQVYLSSSNPVLIGTNTDAIVMNTTNLTLGVHHILVVATNNLGIANNPADPASYLEFSVVEPPPGPPPPPPVVTGLSYPESGQVTVQGRSAASARIDIANTRRGFAMSVTADAGGLFTTSVGADAGDVLALTAWDLAHSPFPSSNTLVTVQNPPVLLSLALVPSNVVLAAAGAWQDLAVMGQYTNVLGPWTSNVTARSAIASDNPPAASVSTGGRVVALARGTARITAAFGGLTATSTVFVNIVTLTNIAVSPPSLFLVSVGQKAQLSVIGQYNSGTNAALPGGNTFLSGDPRVATVDSSGWVTAAGDGLTEITVYRSGMPAQSVPVQVNTGEDPPPTLQIVSPAPGAMVERGQAIPIAVRCLDPTSGVTRVYLAATGAIPASTMRQLSPAAKDTTQIFNIAVAEDAPMGGTITVTAWCEDTSGNLSPTGTLALAVADRTPPTVRITAPPPETSFRYGDTVTVAVAASDASGVSRVRYFTRGSLTFSGARDLSAAPTSTNVVFQFVVPAGVPYPEVSLYAAARDISGNEATNGPLPILISDADLTPPETRVTAVSAPGAGTSCTVTYEVTDGLADLDHVEVFFRRDGYGTFNRYTDADHGNPLGRYTPSGGRFGAVAFDSTKMGGDGAYEFYSVGVDTHGNRESPPATADATAAFSAGTVWTVITNALTIGPADTTYDNVNLRISGVTVTMDGPHGFHNVELLNGATLTHPVATTSNEYGLGFTAWTVTVSSNSAVNADGRGYLGAHRGDNASARGLTVSNAPGSTYRSGGSHGGIGGAIEGAPNPIYGNLVMPSDLGSGGSEGAYSYAGGTGGGRVRMQAVNVVLDGQMTAAGARGAGYNAGSGSGGSIYLIVSTLSGAGAVAATGGGGEVGGGGGRVAVHYVDMATMNSSRLTALGDAGYTRTGGNGTVFLKSVGEGNGTLVVDGQGASMPWSALPIPPGYVFDNIIIRNNARVIVDQPLVVSNRLSIEAGSILTQPVEWTNGLQIVAKRVEVDASSSIDTTGKGYRGGLRDGNPSARGLTLGGLDGAAYRSGGSYGGLGGILDGAGGSPVYGQPNEPVYLGAGGSIGAYSFAGGNGGGRIQIDASEAVVVNGAILARGGAGVGYSAGSGAGGSIWIRTPLLRGAGVIAADGGAHEVGGGGGRVAVEYTFLGGEGDDFSGTRNITACGGHGNVKGSAGTVWMKRSDQAYGDLYIDENLASQTSPLWTPLVALGFGTVQALTDDTLTTDGGVPLFTNALAGLRVNPNLNQPRTFTVVGNTDTSITVRVDGGVTLSDVAAPGDAYAAALRYDNVFFRRGGYLVLADPLIVDGTLWLDEHARLTHRDAATNFEPRLEIQADALVLSSNSSIDVDARGYLGARQPGNPFAQGRTLGNALGSMYRSGGSHGGLGGITDYGPPSPAYDSLTDPTALGSGGSEGAYSFAGGDGGGWIRIVARTMELDGVITAGGGGGSGYQAGSGSGGAIGLWAQMIGGHGAIRANGGAGETGGGGGRIAIHYAAAVGDITNLTLQASGGDGYSARGGAGTIFVKWTDQMYGDLTIDGLGHAMADEITPLPAGHVFDNLTLRNKAMVVANDPVLVSNRLALLTGSVMTHSLGREDGLQIRARRLEIDATSAIDVSLKGYRGALRDGNPSVRGTTLGGQDGAQYRAGGSYGGRGGILDGPGNNPVYGQPADAVYLGSGGSIGAYSYAGGHGGGRVDIEAADSVVVDGVILAAGGTGNGYQAGSGSGGSIRIRANRVEGSGRLAADGGAQETGGGGGRIAIFYSAFGAEGRDFSGTRAITSFGGHGYSAWGSAGTVLLKRNDQARGDLYLDDNLTNQFAHTATPLTPLGFGKVRALSADTLVTDGGMTFLPNALIGLQVNPNLSQRQLFTVTANTETTLTVRVEGPTNLATVAAEGDAYAAVYRFDSLTLRRGGYLLPGDRLIVDGTFSMVEWAKLTQYGAATNFEPRIDITAGTFLFSSNCLIDVTARGYLGARRPGNPFGQGRTLDNALGSTYRSGGSYGGLGGFMEGTPNPTYGSSNSPAALGSGGSEGAYSYAGGDGGGWVKIVAGAMQLEGEIRANGTTASGYQSGSGSGGTIYLAAESLVCSGAVLRADGGAGEVGGGGGRIALHFTAASSAISNLTAGAAGGVGSTRVGSDGTVCFNPLYTSPPGGIFLALTQPDAPRQAWSITGLSLTPEGRLAILWQLAPDTGSGVRRQSAVARPRAVVEFTPDLMRSNWIRLTDPMEGNVWTNPVSRPESQGYFRIRILED